ncbi:MAG: Ldh family oxidoreductase [Pseudomonadota bacterium]
MADAEQIGLTEATDLIRAALMAQGVREAAARSTAQALVAAEAEGQAGHGFSRLEDYAAQVRSGKVAADALPMVTRPFPASIHVDAGHGFAYPALDAALNAGIPVAQEMGVAIMTVTRSHHCGALSVQVNRVAQAGLIGLMVANAPKAIAPWGGADALFGTNPIAFAVPRAGGDPLIIDLSLSVVARGKVMAAAKADKPIPEGWALDADGNATTDAKAALAGTMLPMGGPKGTALALMVEILSAILTGAQRSSEASSFFAAEGPPPGVGQTLLAIRPGADVDFAPRLAALLGDIADMPGARLPGSRRATALAQADRDGITVPAAFLAVARRLAKDG